MFRFRLRTLLIVLAILPPLFAGAWMVSPTVYNVLFVPSGTKGLSQDNGDGTYTTFTPRRDGSVLIETGRYRTKKK